MSFITSAAGVPDHLHPETLACTNLEIAKVFVMADLSKELPDKINYVIQGKDTTVQFTYLGLPPKCVKCGKWGHYETFCKENKILDVEEKQEEDLQEKVPSIVVSEVMEKEKDVENIKDVTKSVQGKEVEGSEDMEKEKEILDSGWKEVSMEKAGRSPKSMMNQEIIAAPSTFAALSNADEAGAELEKEDQVEIEEAEMMVAEDIHQSNLEESVRGKQKDNRRGKQRLTLPRQSKTNH